MRSLSASLVRGRTSHHSEVKISLFRYQHQEKERSRGSLSFWSTRKEANWTDHLILLLVSLQLRVFESHTAYCKLSVPLKGQPHLLSLSFLIHPGHVTCHSDRKFYVIVNSFDACAEPFLIVNLRHSQTLLEVLVVCGRNGPLEKIGGFWYVSKLFLRIIFGSRTSLKIEPFSLLFKKQLPRLTFSSNF